MDKSRLNSLIIKMLRPVIRIVLLNRMSHREFSDIVRKLFVDVADKEFGLEGQEQTVARVSVLTGLDRKEVRRLRGQVDEEVEPVAGNMLEQLVYGWLSDPEYLDEQGKPRPISCYGKNNELRDLIRQYAGDVHVGSVLDELIASGTVEKEGTMLVLKSQAYVPHADLEQKMPMIADASADLLGTLAHNAQTKLQSRSKLQLTTAYDNLPKEALVPIKAYTSEQINAVLQKINLELASYDRGDQPLPEGEERYRAGIGIYYFDERLDAGESSQQETQAGELHG